MNASEIRFTAPALAVLASLLLFAVPPGHAAGPAAPADDSPPAAEAADSQRNPLVLPSLVTATPEDGFRLALQLARMGVSQTQHDKAVLRAGRAEYAHDPAQLIQASQTVAIHFQTVAQANHFWRDQDD